MINNALIEKIEKITKLSDLEEAYQVYTELKKDLLFTDYVTVGCIYKYGKMQGIREERAKRKAKLQHKKRQ